eukprot:COSAG01_NODE_67445_length_267_cov_0.607143_1_plen_47_part_10
MKQCLGPKVLVNSNITAQICHDTAYDTCTVSERLATDIAAWASQKVR